MTIRLAKPDPDHLRALRDASRSMPITYSPARACPPAARALQRAATKRYLDAMQTASGSAL